MTVETSQRKQIFSGGQSALTFSFRTLVSNPEYVKVLLQTVSSGVETDLTYSTDFTVAVNSDGVGGIVTVLPTYSTAYNYVVYRETTAVQEADYDDYNQFPADTLENSLDRTIMILQEQQEETTRTLRYPISETGASTELPAPEADAYLAWNAAATALENKQLPNPSLLVKASTVVAEAATNDTDYMTPLKVKQEVQKAGAVLIPIGNYSPATTTSTLSILALAYPVGSVYINISDSTNPGTLLGFGTWSVLGAGRMIVGFDAGDTNFDTVGETGGANTVDLSHSHGGVTGGVSFGSGTGSLTAGALDTTHNHSITSNLSSAQSVLNKYVACYTWKRTA